MQTRHRAAADQGETGEGPDPTSMDLMARVANLCDTVAQRLVLADHGPQGQGPRPQVPVPLYTGYDDRKSVADFLAELAAYKLATGASDDELLRSVLLGGEAVVNLINLLVPTSGRPGSPCRSKMHHSKGEKERPNLSKASRSERLELAQAGTAAETSADAPAEPLTASTPSNVHSEEQTPSAAATSARLIQTVPKAHARMDETEDRPLLQRSPEQETRSQPLPVRDIQERWNECSTIQQVCQYDVLGLTQAFGQSPAASSLRPSALTLVDTWS
ncbi:hypothetical protein ISCGN_031985 [Ixodes scapularis]